MTIMELWCQHSLNTLSVFNMNSDKEEATFIIQLQNIFFVVVFFSLPHFFRPGWMNPEIMFPPACRSSLQGDSTSFKVGFTFALLDAHLVMRKPNGSLSSALNGRARLGSLWFSLKKQLAGRWTGDLKQLRID